MAVTICHRNFNHRYPSSYFLLPPQTAELTMTAPTASPVKITKKSDKTYVKPDLKGGLCIDCHAPKQNYMVIDGRHDHSFRLPRPDLSLELGSPNACTQCHQDRKSEWAMAAMDKWYGKAWRARPHYGTELHAGATQGIKALPSLMALAQDSISPAIVSASALTLMIPMIVGNGARSAKR